jgi:hypothetical protein
LYGYFSAGFTILNFSTIKVKSLCVNYHSQKQNINTCINTFWKLYINLKATRNWDSKKPQL